MYTRASFEDLFMLCVILYSTNHAAKNDINTILLKSMLLSCEILLYTDIMSTQIIKQNREKFTYIDFISKLYLYITINYFGEHNKSENYVS